MVIGIFEPRQFPYDSMMHAIWEISSDAVHSIGIGFGVLIDGVGWGETRSLAFLEEGATLGLFVDISCDLCENPTVGSAKSLISPKFSRISQIPIRVSSELNQPLRGQVRERCTQKALPPIIARPPLHRKIRHTKKRGD